MTLDASMLRAAAEALRPLPPMAPSEFAARYRHLREGTTARPGLWSNEVFPYLVPVMDAIQEGVNTGKRGVVLMKSGQGGGSEAMINALLWLQAYYPGPMLYLISKDELAREFGRERFGYANETCEPVARKHLPGRAHGELVQVKRYTDGKLVIHGGRSVLNLQSQPYRVVMIDEVDSLLDEIEGHGDPVKLAEVRTDAWAEFGPTLIVAFAHPSTRNRGAGRLYYELSDQRRGHITCPHCGSEFWLSWDHVKVTPHPGQSDQQAERDASAYCYAAPCCGSVLTDAERYTAVQRARQKSTLEPDEARRRRWIGVHFSQLYMTKPLSWLAQEWIEGQDDEGVRRVFHNKRLGDVYEPRVQETGIDAWRALVAEPGASVEAYTMGTVPSWCSYLTAGLDANSRQLHYALWGWGMVDTSGGVPVLCGALVECGVIERLHSLTLEASELHAFDQLLYERTFPTADGKRHLRLAAGFHDSGWQPIAVYEYCRAHRARAVPVKGANEDEESDAPFLRWAAPPRWRANGVEVSDPDLKRADLNTFTLKIDWLGLVSKKIPTPDGQMRPRLVLPLDVPAEYVAQSASEFQTIEKRKMRWRHRGPNHWADCNVYAYAAALNLSPLHGPRTQAAIDAARPKPRPKASPGYVSARRRDDRPWVSRRGH